MSSNYEEDGSLVSSGGVLFRVNDDAFEVCLIAKQDMKVWALPRGRVEPGETAEETALREVKEETGFHAKLLQKLDEINFQFYSRSDDRLINRIVYFYLMEWVDGQPEALDQEVDTAEWHPIDSAIRMLKYENEKDVLRKARNILTSERTKG